MNFNFIGMPKDVEKGLEILSRRYGFKISPEGKSVTVINRPGAIEVNCSSESAEIKYEKKIHFFRAIGLLLEHHENNCKIKEEPVFKTNGIMIDASRNAVMRVEKIKEITEIMAIMGLNLIMMYTEDTYEVPEYPYFGYMRGRYSYEELRECDNYADMFGIEMVPCVQTLGHLEKVLKWNHGINIKDTNDILLAGEEDTYTFIRNILKAATKPYRSNRIHIGMDETASLGLGEYLKKNGYKNHREIMNEHLCRVKAIIDELGLQPMMWGDMFMTHYSKNRDCYDLYSDIPDDANKNVPMGMSVVYWDYYHEKQEEYETLISRYKKFDEELIFAGGIWLWGKMNANYRKTLATTVPALNACKKYGIKEVFAAIWGDGGNQANIYEALLGMQLYAEMGYGHDADETFLSKRFKICTGEDYKAFWDLGLLDDFGQKPLFAAVPNPSEYLLWQDCLVGLVDHHVPEGVSERYAGLVNVFEKHRENSLMCKDIFKYAEGLASVLKLKADFGVRIKKYYDEGNKEMLRKMCEVDIPELISEIKSFKQNFMHLWMKTYKPFGWENIDMRFGALISRAETAQCRITEYLNGEIDSIEELCEERLPFVWCGKKAVEDLSLVVNRYNRYVSVSN